MKIFFKTSKWKEIRLTFFRLIHQKWLFTPEKIRDIKALYVMLTHSTMGLQAIQP
ncbi:MAG: hypothetical protein Q7J06_06625 [Bacteroidales bacterium]|nr:hypothetical protein [Bacteroidales bacterium]